MLYLLHFIAGLLFAGTGYYARNLCRHQRHHLYATIALVAIETIVVVTIIG